MSEARLRNMFQLRKGREAVPANRRASVVIYQADRLTDDDRKRISEWLRSAAKTVSRKRTLFTKRFRATLYR